MNNIGFHVAKIYTKKKGATIEEHIQQAEKKYDIKLKCAQIFIATPTAFKFSVNDENKESLKTFISNSGINLYAHSRYIDNIFSSNVKPNTIGFVKKELSICSEVGIKGFVVHLYKYAPNCVIDSLKTLSPPKNVKIMLETPAISPDKAIYNSALALVSLWKETEKNKLNCGICVDTCHIYASGLNIKDVDTMKEFFTDIIKVVPPESFLIHLNDSAASLGSGKDRHASLGKGLIWEEDQRSLKWLLEFIKKYKICAVLERNEGNGSLEDDFKTVKKLLE